MLLDSYQPPNDDRVEEGLLGSLLADPEVFSLINSIVTDEAAFYKTKHRAIYKAIKEVYNDNKTYDVVLIHSKVKEHSDDLSITIPYLSTIEYPNGLLAERYAIRLMELYNARQTIIQCQKTLSDINDGKDLLEIVSNLKASIDKISMDPSNRPATNIAEDAINVWEKYLDEKDGVENYIPTGWPRLDRYITMKKGHHVLVGGRTGMGKTSFGLNLATNIALMGYRPVFFTMEQSKESMVECYIAQIAGVSRKDFMKGTLSDHEKERVVNTINTWGAKDILNMGIYEGTYSVEQVRHKLITEMAENPVDVVFIDFLHAMKPPRGYKRDGHEWLREASQQLEALAIELNVLIITMVQLNRGVDNRENKRPVLIDIREAGEDNADIVLLLYRDEYYNLNTEEPGIVEVSIAKQRHGPTGMEKLMFINYSTAFKDIPEKKGNPKYVQESRDYGYKD